MPRIIGIETGAPGYRDIVTGHPFSIMPNSQGIAVGDVLEVEVVRYRGYECKTMKWAKHRVREVLPNGMLLCDATPLDADSI